MWQCRIWFTILLWPEKQTDGYIDVIYHVTQSTTSKSPILGPFPLLSGFGGFLLSLHQLYVGTVFSLFCRDHMLGQLGYVRNYLGGDFPIEESTAREIWRVRSLLVVESIKTRSKSAAKPDFWPPSTSPPFTSHRNSKTFTSAGAMSQSCIYTHQLPNYRLIGTVRVCLTPPMAPCTWNRRDCRPPGRFGGGLHPGNWLSPYPSPGQQSFQRVTFHI